jgi:hypothetical protein
MGGRSPNRNGLAFPEDLTEDQPGKGTRGIGSSVPHIGRTPDGQPILPTFIGDTKASAKGQQSPGKPVPSFSKASPTKAAHKSVFKKMNDLIQVLNPVSFR